MPLTVQAGTLLTKASPLTMQLLALESEPYSGNWGVVKPGDGLALDRKIHVAGWNLFFMAGEVKAVFFGALGTEKVKKTLQRILNKVKGQDFNTLEVTGIVAKSFMGVPYTLVTAHSRHLQQSCYLDSAKLRRELD